MKSDRERIRELELAIALLTRELARVNARPPMPKAKRNGSWMCKPDADIAKGASGTVSIYAGEVDTTLNWTAKALGAGVTSGKWCLAWVDNSGKLYVAPWECP